MRVDLKVPFREKDLAKKRGARWDPARRVWYVENVENLRKFMCWMPEHLVRSSKETLSQFLSKKTNGRNNKA